MKSMKNQNTPITHESFPSFVKQVEAEGARLNALKISRTLATVLNAVMSCMLILLAVSVLFCGIDDMKIGAEKLPLSIERVPLKEAVTHYIPDFFDNVAHGVMNLLPDGFDKWWICVLLLLVLIPVSGVISGLIFRWIPFKGKRENFGEDAEKALEDLKKRLWFIKCEVTMGIYVAAIVAAVAVLALPIVSICRAIAEHSMSSVFAGGLFELFALIVVLLIALCLLGFGAFWLAEKQEWVTSLFYRSSCLDAYSAQLKDYQELLKKEQEVKHETWAQETEVQAIELLIAGKLSAALKLLDQLGDEAQDGYYIKKMAEELVEDEPNVWDWCRWLDWDGEKIKSEKLRAFLGKRQAHSREKLLELAEKEYPKALELLEKKDYEEARGYLRAADAIDYRDGVALFALSEYEAGHTRVYSWVIERLTYGISKGIESEKLDVKCRSTLELVGIYQREEQEKKAAEARAEEAYWLEQGRQANMTCKYKQGDYCCRYCTLDNFPPLCFYRDRPRDMYMCDKRNS